MSQSQNTLGTKRPQVRIFRRIINCFLFFFLVSCSGNKTSENSEGVIFTGETQGTTYQIILAEKEAHFQQKEITDLLKTFDQSLSTYVNNSVISTLNQSKGTVAIVDRSGYFKECFLLSEEVFEKSSGAFDPSVYPLVEGWGFMKNMKSPLSKEKVDSILQFVSFEKEKFYSISFMGDTILYTKKDPRFKLDFNAIAQGLAVDKLAEFLKEKGHSNFYVEIGGELIVKGKNREGNLWRIGIDVPRSQDKGEARKLENVMELTDKAMATSGNYRKFYVKDGKKYGHTLNPKTGYPVQHSLLSATVISNSCALSDAYATVFMVLGLEETKQFLQNNPTLDIEVYLLYDSGEKIERFYSPSVENYIQ